MINSIATGSGFATAKTETAALLSGGGFSPLGGGTVNFGGSLTRDEQATAANQLGLLETKGKGFSQAARDAASEGGNFARAAEAVGIQSGGAAGRVAALAGALGSGGGLGIGIGAAIVGLGGLAIMSKSMVDNADQQEAAANALTQAYTAQGKAVPTTLIQGFIDTNAKFVPSMYAVERGFAAAAMAGLSETDQVRLMNDALDLSVARHIDLGTAIDDLIKLKTGRASQEFAAMGIQIKGTVDPAKELTMATKEMTKAEDEKAKADRTLQEEEVRLNDKRKVTQSDLMRLQDLQAKDREATDNLTKARQALSTAQAELNDKGNLYNQQLDQVEGKIRGARGSTSQLQQSQDQLRVTWEKMSNDNGPALASMLATTIGKTNDFLNLLRSSDWGGFSNVLVTIASGIRDVTSAVDGAHQSIVRFQGGASRGTTGIPFNPRAGGAPPPPPPPAKAIRALRSGMQVS